MVFECFDMLGFQVGDERTNHPSLQHTTHRKNLACLFKRRCGNKSSSRWFHANQSVLREAKQGLSNEGARDSELVSQFLFDQFGSGQQTVFHNGAGQCVDNKSGGRGIFHADNDSVKPLKVYTLRFEFPSVPPRRLSWDSAPTF